MKKIKKVLAMIISMSMAVALMPVIQMTVRAADEYIEIFSEDYEGAEPAIVSFEGIDSIPYQQILTDEVTGNKYADINAGFNTHSGYAGGWLNGGYPIGEELMSGEYRISFDFCFRPRQLENNINRDTYASIALANMANVKGNEYKQFKILWLSNGDIAAGTTTLSGDLDAQIGSWYHYTMILNRAEGTYTATVSDGTSEATASGACTYGLAFDGFMFGAGIHTAIDNIVIEKKDSADGAMLTADFDNTSAAFVSFQTNGAKPAATIEGTTNKYMLIDDTKGWSYGGFVFNGAMTNGEYELSFDYSIHQGGAGTYGSAYLTDDSIIGNNSQYKEFKLIDWNNGAVYVNTVLPSGNLEYALNHWYTYHMSIDRSNNTYTVTITDKEDATKKATVSGTNFPDKDINRLMFGTGVIMSVDNIVVSKVYKAPEIVSIDYLDKADNYQTELNTATKKIKVTFSDKMDPETLSEAIAVRAFGGADLDISGALSEDELSYYITINSDIAEDTTYMIEILQSAASKFGFELESDFMTVARATNGNILLDIDYDNIKPDIELYDTNTSPVTYPEEDGNKYITADVSYVNAGYSFRTPIIIDENASYKVSFDFKDYTYQAGYIMALTQKNCLAGAGDLSTYDQFGLLRLDGANFLVAGSNVPGLTYEAGKWYSYELNFNRVTRVYDVTITDKADPENKAHLVSVLPNSAYGAGMYEYRTYNALKFYNKGSISVDNIKVEKTEGVFDIYIDSVKKADADVENISDLSGNISVKVAADNTTGSAVSATVIAAYYDEAGKCIAVSSAPADILENAAENSVTIELSCPENAASAKVMLWDSLGGAKAYCGAYNI